jgi:hypothetical protein
MQKINANDSLEEYQKKMAHNRRVLAQAKAALQRAKTAGIPDKYMRINQSSFESLLDTYYHKDPKKVADFIYKKPLELLRKEFIIIDGGEALDRKKAAFAIFFRLISCDKNGTCMINCNLTHKLQSLNRSEMGENRNDITEFMRNYDLLLLFEAQMGDFTNGFDTGRFYDEILGYRDDQVKPTIITFANALSSTAVSENSENSWVDQIRYGQYMGLAGQSDSRKDSRFFRVRVKRNG